MFTSLLRLDILDRLRLCDGIALLKLMLVSKFRTVLKSSLVAFANDLDVFMENRYNSDTNSNRQLTPHAINELIRAAVETCEEVAGTFDSNFPSYLFQNVVPVFRPPLDHNMIAEGDRRQWLQNALVARRHECIVLRSHLIAANIDNTTIHHTTSIWERVMYDMATITTIVSFLEVNELFASLYRITRSFYRNSSLIPLRITRFHPHTLPPLEWMSVFLSRSIHIHTLILNQSISDDTLITMITAIHQHLRALAINCTHLTSRSFSHLLTLCGSTLHELEIHHIMDLTIMNEMNQLQTLRRLRIVGPGSLDDARLRLEQIQMSTWIQLMLERFIALTHVTIDGCSSVSPSILHHILNHMAATPTCLINTISFANNLSILHASTPLTTEGIPCIPQLKRLNLVGSEKRGIIVNTILLRRLINLMDLRIAGRIASIDLSPCHALRVLDIHDVHLTSAQLTTIAHTCRLLEYIDIRHTCDDAAAVEELILHATKLRHFGTRCILPSSAVYALSTLPDLTYLAAPMNADIKAFNQLCHANSQLTYLDLSKSILSTNAYFKALAHLPTLRYLIDVTSTWTDENIMELSKGCSSLYYLEIRHEHISNTMIDTLMNITVESGLPRLHYLITSSKEKQYVSPFVFNPHQPVILPPLIPEFFHLPLGEIHTLPYSTTTTSSTTTSTSTTSSLSTTLVDVGLTSQLADIVGSYVTESTD